MLARVGLLSARFVSSASARAASTAAAARSSRARRSGLVLPLLDTSAEPPKSSGARPHAEEEESALEHPEPGLSTLLESKFSAESLARIRKALTASSTAGKAGEVRVLFGVEDTDAIALVGLGRLQAGKPLTDKERDGVRASVANAVRALRGSKIDDVKVEDFPDDHAAAEGAFLALYSYDELKTAAAVQKKERKVQIDSSRAASDGWKRGSILAEAQNWARTLAETPSNHLTPTLFAQKVTQQLQQLPNTEVIVRDAAWIRDAKMNSFLSVAHGSVEPAVFLEVRYNPKNMDLKTSNSIVLVGKGVTFDSGGISIKPSANMAAMKADMTGAAVVVSVVQAAAKLGVQAPVVALVPLTENMPSGSATKPGDVVTAMNGKTIEIDNTDAEGRLILADALTYAGREYAPDVIVDVATLTGAMDVALGSSYAGVFSTSDELFRELEAAGKTAGDAFWRMPLEPGYKEQLSSVVADLRNVGGRSGGACTAAAFLREFVDERACNERWAHIDIAGVMESSATKGYHVKGMSGRPTRSLVEFVDALATKMSSK